MINCVVKIGPDGTFKRSGEVRSSPVDIDHIFSTLRESNKRTSPPESITLYFHGGLVSEDDGLVIAKKITNHLQEVKTIPICFVWESDIEATITSRLTTDAGKPLCKLVTRLLVKYLSTHTGLSLGVGISRGAGLSDDEIDRQLLQEKPFDSLEYREVSTRGGMVLNEAAWLALGERARTAEVEADMRDEIDQPGFQDLLNDPPPELAPAADTNGRSRSVIATYLIKRLAGIVMRTMKRFYNGTDHGFYPTIMEEVFREFYMADVGAWVWEGMKSKACTMWKESDGKTGDDLFAGTYFLKALDDYLNAFPATKVNLVGHSAGTISICNLLAVARQRFPGLAFHNIVFLAPACRTELFYEQLVRHQHLYSRFRCFTMTDENECKDLLIPYVYTRSLLYLVSGILEEKVAEPILGLHRFLGSDNTTTAPDFLTKTKQFMLQDNRLVLSATAQNAPAGLQTIALKHGDFDDDLVTIESIKHLIRT
jgi:hypothetical protein